MTQSEDEPKFYLKAPGLEYGLNGPIKMGNIIKNLKLPQDRIAVLDPLPKIVPGSGVGKGSKEHQSHAALNLNFFGKIYDTFGGYAEAKSSNSLRTLYHFDKIETLYFETNPDADDAKRLRKDNSKIGSALNKAPIYIVSGLKIAKGLKYSNRRVDDKHAGVGAHGKVTEEASAGGGISRDSGGKDIEQYQVIGDTILAYQLHIVQKEGFRWFSEPELNVHTYDPGRAGFMNDKEGAEEGVKAAQLTQEVVGYFMKENEYDDAKVVGEFEDEAGAWTLLSVD